MLFNGTYTITSPSGDHRTYKISTNAPDANFAPGQRVVYLLTGPDNEADYTGFGFVTANEIKVWKSKRGVSPLAPSFFDKSAKMLEAFGSYQDEQNQYHKKGVRLELEKRCSKCNRKLTNPASIESGIGPECAKKAGTISLDR